MQTVGTQHSIAICNSLMTSTAHSLPFVPLELKPTMAFHSQHLHFAIFDDDDGACCPLDGRTTKKLFNGITSAFQRSRKQSNGVQAVAILSDNVFLAREDAKTISNIIKDNGGSIQESCGPMVQVKSMEGHSIRIFLVGGINPLVAAMEELIVEDGKNLSLLSTCLRVTILST